MSAVFVGRATFEQQWFFDGRVTDGFEFLQYTGNEIILVSGTDSDGFLHDVDRCFCFLAFEELIESLGNFAGAVGTLDAGDFDGIDFRLW